MYCTYKRLHHGNNAAHSVIGRNIMHLIILTTDNIDITKQGTATVYNSDYNFIIQLKLQKYICTFGNGTQHGVGLELGSCQVLGLSNPEFICTFITSQKPSQYDNLQSLIKHYNSILSTHILLSNMYRLILNRIFNQY